jgi:Spy/CpxP family protein refolding chaperone
MAETEARIKPILTDEQWTKFQELQEKARAEQKAKKQNK